MIIAGTSFLIGSIFQASSTKGHIWLLFIGRVCWGVGEFPDQYVWQLCEVGCLHACWLHHVRPSSAALIQCSDHCVMTQQLHRPITARLSICMTALVERYVSCL